MTGYAQFTAPIVTGLGYLEAVTDQALLELQDPDDLDGDGISGRVQLVDESDIVAEIGRIEDVIDGSLPPRVPVDGKLIGRFGKKASAISLLHQTVSAYHEDMGITSDVLPLDPVNRQVGGFTSDGVADPEVTSSAVEAVVFYLRTLKAPPRRGADLPNVDAGAALFATIGCAKCHLPAMRTGPSTSPRSPTSSSIRTPTCCCTTWGLTSTMGTPRDGALTSEWRTAPLWGIGLAESSQGGMGFFLHDGRARTLTEAIDFHGGEAAASRAAFRALQPRPAADAARLPEVAVNRRHFLQRLEAAGAAALCGAAALPLSGCIGFHYVNATVRGNSVAIARREFEATRFALVDVPGMPLPLYIYKRREGPLHGGLHPLHASRLPGRAGGGPPGLSLPWERVHQPGRSDEGADTASARALRSDRG